MRVNLTNLDKEKKNLVRIGFIILSQTLIIAPLRDHIVKVGQSLSVIQVHHSLLAVQARQGAGDQHLHAIRITQHRPAHPMVALVFVVCITCIAIHNITFITYYLLHQYNNTTTQQYNNAS
jgi:hypothetical protein